MLHQVVDVVIVVTRRPGNRELLVKSTVQSQRALLTR
jgi:hypothetical protein